MKKVKMSCEAIKNGTTGQKGGLFPMLLWTLAASTLKNMLAGQRVIRAGKGTTRAGQDF